VSDPVSWFLIEKGWQVIGSDGKELGKVHESIGDSDKDIFNGLAVTPGMLRSARYVPSERVKAITEGRVVLDLDSQDFDLLDEHGEMPPSARVRPDTTDL
jgi:hypothetical protein